MLRRSAILLCSVGSLLTIAAVGCATSDPGQTVAEERRTTLRVAGTRPTVIHTEASIEERIFAVSPERVWQTLPAVMAQLDIPVTHSDPDRMEYGNQNWRPRRIEGRRMSKYIDCGTNLTGALADTHEITMMLIVRVTRAPGGGATVTSTLDAFGDPRAVSGNPIHCESLKTLEERVVELVREQLRP